MTAVAPAIANAVADAIGVRVFEMPITPERVVTALKRRDASQWEPGVERDSRRQRKAPGTIHPGA